MKVYTDSQKIAESFFRNHDDIISEIRKLDCRLEFKSINFEYVDAINSSARYNMTEEGYDYLVESSNDAQLKKWKEENGEL